MCNLVSIAKRVGAPRIVTTRGIPYPAGDPSLGPADEKAWRRRLVTKALQVVATPVTGPTVFEVDDSAGGDGAPASAGMVGLGPRPGKRAQNGQ